MALRLFRTSGPEKQADNPAGEVAAAVAASLLAQGYPTTPTPEVAAAIVSAWALHRARLAPAATRFEDSLSAWKVAGRIQHMASRVARQERPVYRNP